MPTGTNHRNKTFNRWLLAIAGVVLLVLFLIALNPVFPFEQATSVQDEGARRNALAVEEIAASASQAQVETASLSSRPTQQEQTSQSVADVPSSENCVACHTDKEQLKALAEEPEEVKSEEASGEG